ncbi:MAG: ATP-binding protein [Bryobacterales bacterium]|nr:ATP-binding protein [Bryobacterales bacterium]
MAIPLQRAAQDGSPVLVQGPRGAGKSTLLRQEFPDRLFIDLDAAADRTSARRDPDAFLGRLRRPAILDNLQRAPEMVRYLHYNGIHLPVVFASSIRLRLAMATLELHPPTRAERQRRPALSIAMLGRFVPSAPFTSELPPAWPLTRNLLQQDVRQLVSLDDPDLFDSFLAAVEALTGQPLQQQDLARQIGVSHRTVVRWLEILDACFLTLRLEPWDDGLGRRLVRRPKLHWLGSSASFETEVVTEIYRNACHAGLTPVMRYWRDSNGLEVPLLLEADPAAEPVPIGIAESPNPATEARLLRWMDLAGVSRGALIGRKTQLLERRSTRVLRYGWEHL